MKKILVCLAAVLILLPSCKNTNSPENNQYVDVTIALSGIDIQITPENAPRHAPMASDKNASQAKVKRIALSIYDATTDTLVKSFTETNTDSNFGQDTTLRLRAGSYKFVAVAHGVAATSDPVATINTVSEVSFGSMLVANPTYTTVQNVTISGNTTQTVTIDMGTRKNATFAVKITDDTPSDVAGIELIVSPTSTAYTDLKVAPSTGFAAAQWKYSKSFTLVGCNITSLTNQTFNVPLMLTAVSQQLDVTINVFDSSNATIYTRTLENVTLQQGHKTLASGTFFSPEATIGLNFDITEITDNISLD